MLTDTVSVFEAIRFLCAIIGMGLGLFECAEGVRDVRALSDGESNVTLRAVAYGRRANEALTALAQGCLTVSAVAAGMIPGPTDPLPSVSNIALMLASMCLLAGAIRRRLARAALSRALREGGS